jgi:hypothetical protein
MNDSAHTIRLGITKSRAGHYTVWAKFDGKSVGEIGLMSKFVASTIVLPAVRAALANATDENSARTAVASVRHLA